MADVKAPTKKKERQYGTYKSGSSNIREVMKTLGLKNSLTVGNESARSIKRMIDDLIQRVVDKANKIRLCGGSRYKKVSTNKKGKKVAEEEKEKEKEECADAKKKKSKLVSINGRGTITSDEIYKAVLSIFGRDLGNEFESFYENRMQDVRTKDSARRLRFQVIKDKLAIEKMEKQLASAKPSAEVQKESESEQK